MSEPHPDQETPEKIEKVVNVPCSACGSEMTWSAEQHSLLCKHCGNTRELTAEADLVVEQSFTEALNLADAPHGFDTDVKSFHCKGCGSHTAIPATEVSFSCPFCGSTNVNEESLDTRVIRPSGVMPFKVPAKKATEQFKEWIKKGLFAPNNLKRLAKLDKIRGIYLPFWTYDAFTESSWTAMAGYHYYVTETYRDANGNTQTRQVQRTRWVPASGYYEHFFDDVLVVGSHGVSQRDCEKVYPYELGDIVNYDSRYILGHGSEIYERDVKGGFEVANGIMDNYIRGQCARQIPGDTYRNLNVNTRKSKLTYKHVLLPMYVAGYHYNKKLYQFLVNGQTGKIAGSKPVSWWKVAIAVALGLAVIGTIIYFATRG